MPQVPMAPNPKVECEKCDGYPPCKVINYDPMWKDGDVVCEKWIRFFDAG